MRKLASDKRRAEWWHVESVKLLSEKGVLHDDAHKPHSEAPWLRERTCSQPELLPCFGLNLRAREMSLPVVLVARVLRLQPSAWWPSGVYQVPVSFIRPEQLPAPSTTDHSDPSRCFPEMTRATAGHPASTGHDSQSRHLCRRVKSRLILTGARVEPY